MIERNELTKNISSRYKIPKENVNLFYYWVSANIEEMG